MNASYTILLPNRRHRRWFGQSAPGKASWLAAAGILAIGVPLALGVSFYLMSGGDDDAAAPGDLTSAQIAELALPDLPDAPQASDEDMAAAPTNVNQPPEPVTEENEPETAVETPPEDPSHRVVRMEWGDTLIGLLVKAAVPEAEAHEAMSALRTVYNPSRIQAGEEVTVVFDDAGTFSGFEFEPDSERAVKVERKGDSYKAASVLRPLSNNIMAASVTINGSLYESGVKAGVPVSAMADLVKALSYSVDFQRDIHPGDTFRMMYEVKRNPDGVLVRTGNVLYAEVNLGKRVVPVYRFKPANGEEQFFDGQGKSLRRSLLRTPVNAVRISSGFGVRKHPILGYSKMHRGTDFAAPRGTPIFASGDGVIVERGWKNGFGNYIRIQHNKTMATAYGHMNGFAKGFTRGSRVRQGQIIGYVGSTGRSTGPHLHYEVLINGTQVNPLRVANLNTNEGLSTRELARFKGMVQSISAQFNKVETGHAIDVSFNPMTGEHFQPGKAVND